MARILSHVSRIPALLLACLLLSSCLGRELPVEIPGNPGLPSLDNLPELARELGLPDLSTIPNLPQLSDLPGLDVGPNAVAFAGPTERRIAIGEPIPGTDIQLTGIDGESARFRIAGLEASRRVGDSLDYDGAWPGIGGVELNLRLRIYLVGDDSVRAAGVQRLVVSGIQPRNEAVSLTGTVVKVPYSASVGVGGTLKGLTYGFGGAGDRGAEITGLPSNAFPYRKVGDSLIWEGTLRPEIPVEYGLRVVLYNQETLQVAGLVSLQLP